MNAADVAIAFARAQIGKPYVFGTDGPDSYDCSGLVYAAYRSAGVHLGRVTAELIFDGSPVTKSELGAGDLVFPEPTHVQLYVGNGRIIQAPEPGKFVEEVNMGGVWQARRVTAPGASETGTGSNSGATTAAAVTPVANPFSSFISGVGNFEGTIMTILGDLASSTWWKRIGVAVLGGLLIFLAFKLLTRNSQAQNITVTEAPKTGAPDVVEAGTGE